MKCPKCSTKNPDDSKFCRECAAPLIPTDDVTITKTLQTPPASPGKTIAGKYKILSKLGRGGMGVVYKAKDTRLKRTVALKFLPVELTKDKAAKKRFIQEAQAAAALNHSQICTIYEVDETDGQTFIAMEFIEGQSLKDKLKDGPLDIDEAKDIALQVAEGLKEAHEKGIIHRDIKPANIMLTKKGQAKITDFGLAKLSWGVDLTKTSTIMGTVAYMSPEQARGEDVDQRTDIWSLGAMLYEMLSSERPFHKSQEQALIFAILNDKPTPLTLLRSDVPTHIEQVIEKALAKKVSDRYHDIQELIQDLELSISFPKAEKSIVVLPFENLSPDPEQDYFCDGMTEEIISDLSQIQDLLVISRSSAMTFKGTKKKIRDIAKDLNVQYVLEGSVRKAGNNLRITAQLIEAANDLHLWAEKYSGTLDDVFDIQEKVSRSIVDALKMKLSPEENKKLTTRPIDNVHAYECYLRALHAIWQLTKDSIDLGLRYLLNGLDIVGENALLYSTLTMGYMVYHDLHFPIDEDPIMKAEEYAKKAWALAPESASTLLSLAFLERGKCDLKKAAKYIKQALDIDPTDPEVMFWYVWINSLYIGKTEKTAPVVKKLLEIDPLKPLIQQMQGHFELMSGRLPQAIELYKRNLDLNPDFWGSYLWYASSLAWNTQFEEALEIVDQLIKLDPTHIGTEIGILLKHVLKGERDDAIDAITEGIETYIGNDPEGIWFLVDYYSLINEKDQSLKWLEHAVNQGFINYPFLNEIDPLLENIREEPRFKKLMERVKHEWENFEV